MLRKQKGAVLPLVVLMTIIFAILGIALLRLAENEISLTRIDVDKTKAFYLAETGLAKLSETLTGDATINTDEVFEGTTEQGNYQVEFDIIGSTVYAVSTGTSGTVDKKIRVQVSFLAPPFEDAVYARNGSGKNWSFMLRGKGDPVATKSGEKGGRDIIRGNISVDGDAYFFEESSVNPAPAPNIWGLAGDVSATGGISVLDSASISGATSPFGEEPPPVDLTEMDYANNNTHNVSQIFQAAGVTSGTLPSGNELRDIFVINPSNRSAECSSTTGNDYFLEPTKVTGGGSQKDATTPLHLGNERVYYIDGDVWIHNQVTYGFLVDGKVTIVATGDIHISDNVKYADDSSILGLIALGKYDNSGQLTSGGNVYFGDPRYGTMYTVSALMFAGNDFLYSTDAVSRAVGEPTTGFTVNGSFAAMNQVLVERDWYTKGTIARPARYNSITNQWIDSETGTALTSTEITSLRHYQMIVNYDERVRNADTQPPGLPRGGTGIFTGFSNWEEL